MNTDFQKDYYRITGNRTENKILFIKNFIKHHEIRFMYFYRNNNRIFKRFYRLKYGLEIYSKNIGEGLYLGHAFNITINQDAIIGKNCNIHKGVTIGQENRGKRKGVPKIGNKVWIGVNSTIVGKINIGNNVLTAPNSYVNCDIPDDSIVFGNPCIIKHNPNATWGYIINTI